MSPFSLFGDGEIVGFIKWSGYPKGKESVRKVGGVPSRVPSFCADSAARYIPKREGSLVGYPFWHLPCKGCLPTEIRENTFAIDLPKGEEREVLHRQHT